MRGALPLHTYHHHDPQLCHRLCGGNGSEQRQKAEGICLYTRRSNFLMLSGTGHERCQCRRYLPLIRHVDSLWLFHHRRVCVQISGPRLCRLERRCYHRYCHLITGSHNLFCSKRAACIAGDTSPKLRV